MNEDIYEFINPLSMKNVYELNDYSTNSITQYTLLLKHLESTIHLFKKSLPHSNDTYAITHSISDIETLISCILVKIESSKRLT